MGLKEKQLMASLDYGWAIKRIKSESGNDVAFELDKATFESDEDAILYAISGGADKMANAIAFVCRDSVGKDAFNEKGVKKIVLKNLNPDEKKSLDIKNGTLTMASGFGANNAFSEDELKETLTNLL